MSLFDPSVTKRSLRRREAGRSASRTVALLLMITVGVTGAWLTQSWRESGEALRRPVPQVGLPTSEPTGPETETPPQIEPTSDPLPHGDLQAQQDAFETQPLTGSLEERLSTLSRLAPGPNAIWFYDLTSNTAVSIGGERAYPAASTAKVPLVMYLYHQAATNRVSLNQKVLMQKEDWSAGTGVLQAVEVGHAFTLRELARLAFVHSDNIAANVLLRTLGERSLASYLRELGIGHDQEHKLISPKDLGLAFRHLWRMAQKYPDPWEEPLQFLRENVFHNRLPAGVPNEVPIANKIGSVDLAFHDAGIVYHKEHPYILVVMTNGMGERQAERYISRVSKEVWLWQDNLP